MRSRAGLRTRHHLRVLSGERGKEGAAGGDVSGVPREARAGGAGDVAMAELKGRRRVGRGMGKGDGLGGVERTVGEGGACRRGQRRERG